MPDQKRLTPEMLVPRMGEYLVQKGLVSADDIQKALAHQQEETDRGNNILLGQALIDLNLISRADLDHAVGPSAPSTSSMPCAASITFSSHHPTPANPPSAYGPACSRSSASAPSSTPPSTTTNPSSATPPPRTGEIWPAD